MVYLFHKMVSTRSSTKLMTVSKGVEQKHVVVYPEAEALRRFSTRLNALIKAQDAQNTPLMVHRYNLRPRPVSTVSMVASSTHERYNLRPRRHVCYAE
jgi:hypothetical protein